MGFLSPVEERFQIRLTSDTVHTDICGHSHKQREKMCPQHSCVSPLCPFECGAVLVICALSADAGNLSFEAVGRDIRRAGISELINATVNMYILLDVFFISPQRTFAINLCKCWIRYPHLWISEAHTKMNTSWVYKFRDQSLD